MNAADNLSKLKSLGYNQFFEDAKAELGVEEENLARVVAEHKGVYEIIGVAGEGRAKIDIYYGPNGPFGPGHHHAVAYRESPYDFVSDNLR